MKHFLIQHEDMRRKYSDVKASLVGGSSTITMLEYRTGKQGVLKELSELSVTWWKSLSEGDRQMLIQSEV